MRMTSPEPVACCLRNCMEFLNSWILLFVYALAQQSTASWYPRGTTPQTTQKADGPHSVGLAPGAGQPQTSLQSRCASGALQLILRHGCSQLKFLKGVI